MANRLSPTCGAEWFRISDGFVIAAVVTHHEAQRTEPAWSPRANEKEVSQRIWRTGWGGVGIMG